MGIGKMRKHREMLQHSILRHHLPETHWLTHQNALQMLKLYSTIFIKPDHGSGGSGIIRAKRIKNGYEVRCGSKQTHAGSGSLYKTIQSYCQPSKRYLVQRGIHLAPYNGSIFDIRIYMQKPKKNWIISGMVARVAAPNLFVTNYQKGGFGVQLNQVLLNLFADREKVNTIRKKITNLSYLIARTMSKHHSFRELGIDIGIEKSGRIWIIEANSKPGHKLFTQLADKTSLRKIKKNKRLIKREKLQIKKQRQQIIQT
ncbi:YheC/YheD family protein [Brevibacillus laterosporus]|uniref:Endospore coat-associated protein YheC n=1 Tax=Brevibacillus laterosporus TaxID=1465 RepID=A0AAP8QB48_BRELA|nr:YheC/YheD family protein [Brevibacillus laterosporus]PPA93820.1 endospore coat-associated protein YheC [Brevibacillus laterosporus]